MKKKNIFPPTSQRVLLRSDPQANAEIRSQTIKNLNIFKNCDSVEMADRIQILNQEWDTERLLEVNASLLIVLSSYLGVRTSRIWFLLTGTVSVFMLWHAFLGWCPLLPVIRKLGVRTEAEIGAEKAALKYMRGDFKDQFTNVEDALAKAELQ